VSEDGGVSTVLYESRDGVGLVTLNRPHRGNAWTGRMEMELREALVQAAADPAVRVIVVTGAGERFCVGGDSQALEGHVERGSYDSGVTEPLAPVGGADDPDLAGRFSFLWGVEKPVVAAVNGAAAGLGFVLMCFCDLRFAAEGAKLTISFPRLGLPAEAGISWLLPRLVGTTRAADLLLTSRVMAAEEAERIGLVNRVLPAERLLPETMAFARRLGQEMAPSSLRVIKEQLYSDLRGGLAESQAVAHRRMDEMIGGTDFKEGVAALVERRPPRFS
jgi:enoyl-CoA hydratase/carnithine racemase